MNEARDDASLLREYLRSGSREALGELARRHAGMVYAAARRQVRDAHLAEDVTQAVFILLAAKASSVRDPAHLVGWLYRTTRFTAANAMRIEQRRKFYEQRAGENMIKCENETDPAKQWEELSPVLDGALAQLGQGDRETILLRYFRGLSVHETAEAMSISEDAAKKRISRGLEKLRKLLVSKGFVVSAVALAATLEARAAEQAPAAVGQAVHAITIGKAGAASKIAGALAQQHSAASWPFLITGAGIAASVLIAVAVWRLLSAQVSPAARAEIPATEPSPVVAAVPPAVMREVNPPLTVLSGEITGGAMVADLDGDGKPEIIVPYMGMIPGEERKSGETAAGGEPDYAAYVGAFHLDGTPLAGWPVKVMSAEDHKAMRPNEFPNWWESTPAVVAASGNTPGYMVIALPSGPEKKDRGVMMIRADGSAKKLGISMAVPDPGTTLTLADLNGDGVDVLGGGTSCTIHGGMIAGWRGGRIANGFSASAGDTKGDGRMRMYMVTQRHGASNATVVAVDGTGKMFGGWPQKIGIKTFAPPSLGNVFGDGTMEVIVPDFRGHILAWTWDGKPFGNCKPEETAQSADDSPLSKESTEHEKCHSIFKDDVGPKGPVSLADLDGDGLAEIIVMDGKNNTLRAWHGDGTGFGNADGIIAHLGSSSLTGVSVAGPDDAGGFDFFTGGWWVHRNKDGTIKTRSMVALVPGTPVSNETVGAEGPAPETADTTGQDTIANLDGEAAILIGTADGRLYIYRTGLKYSDRWAQWPMFGRDLQHTSCWRKG